MQFLCNEINLSKQGVIYSYQIELHFDGNAIYFGMFLVILLSHNQSITIKELTIFDLQVTLISSIMHAINKCVYNVCRFEIHLHI